MDLNASLFSGLTSLANFSQVNLEADEMGSVRGVDKTINAKF